MAQISQLTHPEADARNIELKLTTCMRSKRFKDPSSDGANYVSPIWCPHVFLTVKHH
jgi:hypothetical protein